MSTKRYCDICEKEIGTIQALDYRDCETQYYELIRKNFDKSIRDSVDICNDCFEKVIKLAEGELHIFEEQVNVFCEDCKHYINHDKRCGFFNHGMETYDYCSYAEKRKAD